MNLNENTFNIQEVQKAIDHGDANDLNNYL